MIILLLNVLGVWWGHRLAYRREGVPLAGACLSPQTEAPWWRRTPEIPWVLGMASDERAESPRDCGALRAWGD